MMNNRRLRLLSLDGGGVRGLSSLMILQHIMATVDPQSPPKPCEYFDMIGGTSTGGYVHVPPPISFTDLERQVSLLSC
jgi:patatin-like phospholipase/acyl hydrolase